MYSTKKCVADAESPLYHLLPESFHPHVSHFLTCFNNFSHSSSSIFSVRETSKTHRNNNYFCSYKEIKKQDDTAKSIDSKDFFERILLELCLNFLKIKQLLLATGFFFDDKVSDSQFLDFSPKYNDSDDIKETKKSLLPFFDGGEPWHHDSSKLDDEPTFTSIRSSSKLASRGVSFFLTQLKRAVVLYFLSNQTVYTNSLTSSKSLVVNSNNSMVTPKDEPELKEICDFEKRKEYATEMFSIIKLSTGCIPIDRCLRGGFRAGSLTEIFSGSGTGKTCLVLQTLLHAVIFGAQRHFTPWETNNAKRPISIPCGVLYITPDQVPYRRLEQLAYGIVRLALQQESSSFFIPFTSEKNNILSPMDEDRSEDYINKLASALLSQLWIKQLKTPSYLSSPDAFHGDKSSPSKSRKSRKFDTAGGTPLSHQLLQMIENGELKQALETACQNCLVTHEMGLKKEDIMGKCGIIAIDSIAGNNMFDFQMNYSDKKNGSRDNERLRRGGKVTPALLGYQLRKFAIENHVAIIVTNQARNAFLDFEMEDTQKNLQSFEVPALGYGWSLTADTRIHLSKVLNTTLSSSAGKAERYCPIRRFTVLYSSEIPPATTTFSVTERGITS